MSERRDEVTADAAQQVTLQELLATTRALASERPIFHNEADFQHALAWRLHERWPTARVRLESRPIPSEPLYLDIWLGVEQEAWAIELKYAVRRMAATVVDETFVLPNRGAQDILRYDFIRDIVRLERITQQRKGVQGLALLLTNDPSYWQPSGRADTNDADFRLHQGRTISGILRWGAQTGGTAKGRQAPHQLSSEYQLTWQDYSVVEGRKFRFLSVYVARRSDRMLLK